MWVDLQETFFITLGPFIVGLLLLVFVAAAILLAVLMAVSKWWRPMERISVVYGKETISDDTGP